MTRTRRLVAVGVLTVSLAGVLPAVALATTPTTTLAVSAHTVVQRDAVTLSGRSKAGQVVIYRSLNGGRYVSYTRVPVSRGRYSVSVKPIAGDTNRYRVSGAPHVNVHSIACTPLASSGSTAAWFNVRRAAHSAMAENWTQTICSAARGSTITLAAMLVWGGSPSTDALIAALRAVAEYRGVHVDVITERSQFTAATPEMWTFAKFSQEFSFASIHSCEWGCTVASSTGSMHAKYMTISRTVFGGPVVIETTLNWSPQQFDRQNGSAIYFYANTALYAAYAAESSRMEKRTPSDATTESIGWRAAGSDVAYAFDPSATMADPITDELATLTCLPGDYVDVVNANVTRGRLVRQLDRLQAAGCGIRIITEQLYAPPAASYTARHMTTHDKFVLVHNHAGNEVLTGSEDYRPRSMLLAEEQLVRVRTASVVSAYDGWFDTEWAQAH